jgi:hypothetical protein
MLLRRRDRPNTAALPGQMTVTTAVESASRERLQIIISDAILLRQQWSIAACTAMLGKFRTGRDETNGASLAGHDARGRA